jgi:GDP/UDP-N,N'-diacetylbacillosamine 2-epimerase (hydrolysing)
MQSTLRAIEESPRLKLQLIATGMHCDPVHGGGVKSIRAAGFTVDRVVSWPRANSASEGAAATGQAMSRIATAFASLNADLILVVGDRVEAFAAASAAAISGRIVAHVHGGDRALGQVDDSLRHAITKLAHVHFPATPSSAARLRKLGEDRWRIHRAGSPGVDGITQQATSARELAEPFGSLPKHKFALLVLHPTSPDPATELKRARLLLRALLKSAIPHVLIIGPNNDAGSSGILRCWSGFKRPGILFHPDIARPQFLGLMRDAAFLIGNSSSGIIEAASFGTPVIDVGDRQLGRERGGNVRHVAFETGPIERAIQATWRNGRPIRFPRRNLYGGGGAGRRIADVLQEIALDDRLRRKLIAY